VTGRITSTITSWGTSSAGCRTTDVLATSHRKKDCLKQLPTTDKLAGEINALQEME